MFIIKKITIINYIIPFITSNNKFQKKERDKHALYIFSDLFSNNISDPSIELSDPNIYFRLTLNPYR